MRVVARADVVVVGGGPAGFAAAIAAARKGARYACRALPYLGGLASGGMVLVLDDMWATAQEITVRGICMEMIERMAARGLAVFPPDERARAEPASVPQMVALGRVRFPQPAQARSRSCFAAAFDPDGWKRVSQRDGAGSRRGAATALLVLAARSSKTVASKAWSARRKAGRQAILGDVVIDATGDLDVAASAGAPFTEGAYIVTTVFRLGGVDTDEAERFRVRRARKRTPRSTSSASA